uniref:Probable cytosolic oligopeptidase A isoform X1 n=1 Tax=Diabrotica virgifera virgifera TaxID=50390 RepID=A0A6P7FIT4_DIAVI
MIFAQNWSRALLKRNILNSCRYQHGYIILVPEIGEDVDGKDSASKQTSNLPEFNNVTIENCRAAIAKQSLEFEEGVKNIEKEIESNPKGDIFQQIFKPLEVVGGPLDVTWGVSKTLYLGNSTLMPTSSYMAIHERARKARASKYNSKSIYSAVKTALNIKTERSSEESRILQKFATEGRLNGLELDSTKKVILSEYLNKLNKEKTLFRQKTEVSTKRFTQTISDPEIIKDIPKSVLKLLAIDPNNADNGPWKLNLQPYSYMPVMEYCSERDIRWNLWQALVSRGSKMGDSELSTSLHIEEIRMLRRDVAGILGFETFADMSLQTKMVKNTAEIKNILLSLLEVAKSAQDAEVKQLYDFAVENGFEDDKLELWDVPYWKRKQQQSLYAYSENDFKQYFPLKTVLSGLFRLCEKLFDIHIKERSGATVWHKDVKFYDIFEKHSSAPVAGFYFDPYARDQQKLKIENTGWMVAIQNKSTLTDRIPLASLIFNFDPCTGSKDSFLNFKEVKSLFHKFGNNLQHLLTRTNYSEVAGLSNVEWDAVEVCGYLLSHWLNNKSVIDSITSHCETGEKLPEDMYKSLVHTDKHMAGLDLCRDLYLASLDLELHTSKEFWLDIVKMLWPEHRNFTLHKIDVHLCSFTQIFSEEWAAAYYCHIWSRMIAADIYSAFYEVRSDEEQTKEVGRRFRNLFLALGGSVDPGQIFREFRGRDPSPKALLSSLGLKK